MEQMTNERLTGFAKQIATIESQGSLAVTAQRLLNEVILLRDVILALDSGRVPAMPKWNDPGAVSYAIASLQRKLADRGEEE